MDARPTFREPGTPEWDRVWALLTADTGVVRTGAVDYHRIVDLHSSAEVTLMMNTTTTPTADQWHALWSYASLHGRTWKHSLRADWMTACAHVDPELAGPLQQLRNTFGPRWLMTVTTADVFAAHRAADPHCTCSDCIAHYAGESIAAENAGDAAADRAGWRAEGGTAPLDKGDA